MNYYSQNDIIKLSLRRRYENCDIDSDLAAMIIPFKETNQNMAYSMFNAELVTRNNHHLLKAAPKTIPLRRRDRLNQSSLRKYTYGKLNLSRLLSAMRQSGLVFKVLDGLSVVVDESGVSSGKYCVEMDKTNRVDLDLDGNRTEVVCDNDEYRVKVKDCLLKCLSSL